MEAYLVHQVCVRQTVKHGCNTSAVESKYSNPFFFLPTKCPIYNEDPINPKDVLK